MITFNFPRGVHANIWGLKFYVKSIFGVCELQHGQKFNILDAHIWKKEESWNLVLVSKILDSIFGVPKTLGVIFRGQQRKSGMDPPPILKVREYPLSQLFNLKTDGDRALQWVRLLFDDNFINPGLAH